MLVRCSTWSRDGYRCLCACSLRPSVSASLCAAVPPLLCEAANELFFHQFIITRSEEGAEPNVGVSSGHMDGKQKDIDLSAATFHFGALTVTALIRVLTNCGFISTPYLRHSYIIRIEFSGFKESMQHNNKFISNAARIPYSLFFFWLFWPWMRTNLMIVLADCFLKSVPNCSLQVHLFQRCVWE